MKIISRALAGLLAAAASTALGAGLASAATPGATGPRAVAPITRSTASTSDSSSSTTSSSVGSRSSEGGDVAGRLVADAARTKVGGGYCEDGQGPTFFDSPGLTMWAWAQAGIRIPRTTSGQANLPSVPLDQLEPGDLVTYYAPAIQVAMYVGDGMVVLAADEEHGIVYVPVNRAGPQPTGHRVAR